MLKEKLSRLVNVKGSEGNPKLWKPTYCNCIIWAYLQRLVYGGKVIHSKVEDGWWHHYTWLADDGCMYDYYPIDRKEDKGIPPPIFKGKVRRLCQ